MKTNKTSLQKILLTMAVALPLCAGAVGANDMEDHPAAMLRGGPDRDGADSGPRMPGGAPPSGPPGMAGMVGRPLFLRSIELSEAQDDKVFAILHEEKPYLRAQGKAAARAQEALGEMAGADKYDDAKAAALAQVAASAMANISLQRVRTEQKLLAVLTPEQRKKLEGDKDGREKPRRPRS